MYKRQANLCIAGGMAVNGVSGLHSEILKKDVFKEAYGMEPWKFQNVTNGIDHRRWLSEINPGLDGLIRDLTGGDDYLLRPQALKKLDDYADDASVLETLGAIKRANKESFTAYAKKTRGVELNPDAIFDVQVKRLHEYKRQLLNVLHIIALYQKLQDCLLYTSLSDRGQKRGGPAGPDADGPQFVSHRPCQGEQGLSCGGELSEDRGSGRAGERTDGPRSQPYRGRRRAPPRPARRDTGTVKGEDL